MDEWDDMLAGSLRARPEYTLSGDLAAEALRRAKAQEERRAGLLRLGRRVRLCTAAACVLVVGMVAISLIQWPSFGRDSGASGGSAAVISATDTSNAGALVTWGLVLAGLLALVVWRVVGLRDDRMSHAM